MMWRLVSCAVFVFLGWQLGSVRAGAAEPEDQVQIQVLFRPEECSRKSKKGDLINAHYDGFLEKDGSQFYCRSVLQETGPVYSKEVLVLVRRLTGNSGLNNMGL